MVVCEIILRRDSADRVSSTLAGMLLMAMQEWNRQNVLVYSYVPEICGGTANRWRKKLAKADRQNYLR